MPEIRRDQLQHWLQIPASSDDGTGTYALMGDGITDLTVAGNPNTATTKYIHQQNGSTVLSGYAPSAAVTATAFADDPVSEYLMDLGRTFKTGEKAKSKMVNVDMFEEASAGAYPAVQWDVDIAIDNPGSGSADAALALSATIYYRGDPVEGTFNPSTKTFTANEAA